MSYYTIVTDYRGKRGQLTKHMGTISKEIDSKASAFTVEAVKHRIDMNERRIGERIVIEGKLYDRIEALESDMRSSVKWHFILLFMLVASIVFHAIT